MLDFTYGMKYTKDEYMTDLINNGKEKIKEKL